MLRRDPRERFRTRDCRLSAVVYLPQRSEAMELGNLRQPNMQRRVGELAAHQMGTKITAGTLALRSSAA